MKNIDTWLKWLATACLIIGAVLTTVDIRPLNIWLFNIGNLAWLIVGIMWREWSLVVLNIVLIAIYAYGILFTFV
jgi:hypothetical protein